jgi:thiol-disulfide isomerase/thioredoxin
MKITPSHWVLMLSVLWSACAKSPAGPSDGPNLRPPHHVQPAKSVAESVRTSTQSSLTRNWTRKLASVKAFKISEGSVQTSTATKLGILTHSRKAALIQVFASYCPPCLREIPNFNALYSAGYPVAGLSLDASNHAGLLEIIRDHKPSYPIAVVTASSLELISTSLEGLPMTLVLDHQGEVTKVLFGLASTETLLKLVK